MSQIWSCQICTYNGYTFHHEKTPPYKIFRMCNHFSIGLLYLFVRQALWNRMGPGGMSVGCVEHMGILHQDLVEFSHGGMFNHFRYTLDIIKIEKLWLIKTRGKEEWTVNSIVIHHKIVFTRDLRKYHNKYFLKDLDTINWVKS